MVDDIVQICVFSFAFGRFMVWDRCRALVAAAIIAAIIATSTWQARIGDEAVISATPASTLVEVCKSLAKVSKLTGCRIG